MPMREGVDLRHRKIRARRRNEATTIFFRIKRRISDRRRKVTLKTLARIMIIRRRRSLLGRRKGYR